MVKVFKINFFFLCLLLLLFGCNEQKKNVAMSASSQIKDPVELIKLAVSKQETGAYDEAIDILDQVLAVNAQYAPAHYQKGLIYEEWDRRKESLASYNKAIEINPTQSTMKRDLALHPFTTNQCSTNLLWSNTLRLLKQELMTRPFILKLHWSTGTFKTSQKQLNITLR